MKLAATVFIAIAVLGAEVVLAVPAAVEHENSPTVAGREVHPGAKGFTGGRKDAAAFHHGPEADDHGPSGTEGVTSVTVYHPHPQGPPPPGFTPKSFDNAHSQGPPPPGAAPNSFNHDHPPGPPPPGATPKSLDHDHPQGPPPPGSAPKSFDHDHPQGPPPSGATSVALYRRPLIPPPAGIPPKSIGHGFLDAKAKRTLVTVASGDQATDNEPSKGAVGFMGAKIKDLRMAIRAAEPTPAPVLDDRETPCVAENDCGAKSSPAPSSTSAPPPSTSSSSGPATPDTTPATTTLANALTPVPSLGWGSEVPAPAPALSCWEARDGQVRCVPYGDPQPTSA
ncbi:MAG: hypothetical protein Q9191_001014 [Dirinaria sp. TL-2023a]